MPMPSSIRNLLHRPSRFALLFGLGALSVAGAKADTGGEIHPDRDGARVPQQSVKSLADLKIWKENGRIYISEAGKPAEELRLGNTAEAELLGRLLEGSTVATPRVLRDRIILVGGGGDGFHLESAHQPGKTSASGIPANVKASQQPSIPAQTSQPGEAETSSPVSATPRSKQN
jgi:hypothetical protein